MDNTLELQIFGTHLRKIREQHKLSLSQLSFMAELTKETLYRIENGKHRPRLDSLISIAKALEIPMSELMNFEIQIQK